MSMVDLTPTEQKIAGRIDPDVSKALTISQEGRGIIFRNATEITEFAKMMALSKVGVRSHLRGNVGACLAIVVQAVEWEMSPFAVASKSYVVNDQIAFESQLIQAVILRRAPIKGRIKFEFIGQGQDRQVRAWARDREDPTEVYEILSPKLKDIKPKNSPLWTADPDQQLTYYGGRTLCRRHFPDVLLGVYDHEELEGQLRSDGSYDALPSSEPPRSRGFAAALDKIAAGSETAKDGAVIDNTSYPQDEQHDPDTGKIRPQEADQAEGGADEQEEGQTPREALLSQMQSQVVAGERVTKLLNALGERRALLADEDVAALRRAEKAMGQGGAAA